MSSGHRREERKFYLILGKFGRPVINSSRGPIRTKLGTHKQVVGGHIMTWCLGVQWPPTGRKKFISEFQVTLGIFFGPKEGPRTTDHGIRNFLSGGTILWEGFRRIFFFKNYFENFFRPEGWPADHGHGGTEIGPQGVLYTKEGSRALGCTVWELWGFWSKKGGKKYSIFQKQLQREV